MKTTIATTVAASILSAPSWAQNQPAAKVNLTQTATVVTIVEVPKPAQVSKTTAIALLRGSAKDYDQIPGLAFKMFSLSQPDGQSFGGIYLWKNRISAETWFSPAWHERVEKSYSSKGIVRYLDAPIWIDNVPDGTAQSASDDTVATVVTIAVPKGITREILINEFQAAMPIYQRIPGLLRKYFTITNDGKFGGVYLWDKKTSALNWFGTSWYERVHLIYGHDVKIEWFNIPALVPSKLAENNLTPSPL
jgi:hypothetical protein